jgi:hypothetical protein
MAFSAAEALSVVTKVGPLLSAAVRPPRNIRDLVGDWHSRYQRVDEQAGKWVDEMTRVRARWPKTLIFTNYKNPSGVDYRAIGAMRTPSNIIGTWGATHQAAVAGGMFHLYADVHGRMLYGLCSCPTNTGAQVYAGWVFAREEKDLNRAQGILVDSMLLGLRVNAPVTRDSKRRKR